MGDRERGHSVGGSEGEGVERRTKENDHSKIKEERRVMRQTGREGVRGRERRDKL